MTKISIWELTRDGQPGQVYITEGGVPIVVNERGIVWQMGGEPVTLIANSLEELRAPRYELASDSFKVGDYVATQQGESLAIGVVQEIQADGTIFGNFYSADGVFNGSYIPFGTAILRVATPEEKALLAEIQGWITLGRKYNEFMQNDIARKKSEAIENVQTVKTVDTEKGQLQTTESEEWIPFSDLILTCPYANRRDIQL